MHSELAGCILRALGVTTPRAYSLVKFGSPPTHVRATQCERPCSGCGMCELAEPRAAEPGSGDALPGAAEVVAGWAAQAPQ